MKADHSILNCLILYTAGFFAGIVLLFTGLSMADDMPARDKPLLVQDHGKIEFQKNSSSENTNQNPNEDLDDFFEDDPEEGSEKEPLKEDSEVFFDSKMDSNKAVWSLNGSIKAKTGYRFNHDPPLDGATDQRGLSDAKGEIDLELRSRIFNSWDFFISGSGVYNLAYELKDRDNYTAGFLDENEKELVLDKLYLRGSLTRSLDVKIGRQIVVWGKSDNIRVTDVLNPLDLREPGMTDIEDLRLPVFMTRFDYYVSNLSLSGFLIHEHRFHELPVFGSSFFYLPFSLPGDTDPATSIENTELALSLSVTLPGFDISFYVADIYDNSAYLDAQNQRLHGRIFMTGVAANMARGNFLYKAEASLFKDLRLSAFLEEGVRVDNFKAYSSLDVLAGFEYSGFKNTLFSIEAADKWLMNYGDAAQKSGYKEHGVQYALRVSKTFYNEVLELILLASLYGKAADEGGFVRTQGTYDLSDELSLTLGLVFYTSGPSAMLREIGENDTIFSSLTYSF